MALATVRSGVTYINDRQLAAQYLEKLSLEHPVLGQDEVTQRLSCIEEMAGMDILCSDKTGTLTLGRMAVVKAECVPFDGHSLDDWVARQHSNSGLGILQRLLDLLYVEHLL